MIIICNLITVKIVPPIYLNNRCPSPVLGHDPILVLVCCFLKWYGTCILAKFEVSRDPRTARLPYSVHRSTICVMICS